MFALPIDTDQIIVTASRFAEEQAQSPASATIFDKDRIERLGEPLVPALLRLAPSVALTTQGPAGLLTEVRIRGAENNHTLLFIDGIRANDPATGDFARFELLNADLASRIEIVRGPQSALWGSQAIGGVIAIDGRKQGNGVAAGAEAGSFGLVRGHMSAGFDDSSGGIAGAIGWQRAAGIDSFSGDGDKDGYRNLSVRLRGILRLGSSVEIGAAGFALSGESEFDGYDPLTFDRTDTLDNSRNRLAAGRLWANFHSANSPWLARAGASLLESSNQNHLGNDPVNRTRGARLAFDAQVERGFTTGDIEHRLLVALDAERETFHARDSGFGGFTRQDRSRSHRALTAEWRASTGRLTADVALRHDQFNRFADATTLRASMLVGLGRGFSVAGSYAEGIAQPTFFDLYGFFPNNFVGNPALTPESSRGFEISLRFRRPNITAALTVYRQRLDDEIVDVFNSETFQSSTANRERSSRRTGVELELGWRPLPALRVTASYAYLKATQPGSDSNSRLEELRRPKHSGAIAADGASGRWSWGTALAFSGSRLDREEIFPFDLVSLRSYWLATARLAYDLSPALQVHARATNLFGARYEESAGYRTEGRGLFVGLKLADRRSSP